MATNVREHESLALSQAVGSAPPVRPNRGTIFLRRCLTVMAACGGFAVAAGCFNRAASLPRHCDRARECLRVGDVEKLAYEIVFLQGHPEIEPLTCVLRAWLNLQTKGEGVVATQGALADRVRDDLLMAAEDQQLRPLALALMGRVFYEAGQLNGSLDALQRSLALNPDEAEAHRWLGVAFYDIGLIAPALQHLDRLANLEPHNGRPHRTMGLIYREERAFDKAAEAYQESLARDPNPPDGQEIRVELARCLFLERKFNESLAALGASDSADACLLRGECSYAKGEVEEAGRCANEALKRDGQDADVLAFKATLATVAGNQREAADLLAKAVRQKPNEYQLRYRLVQAYRRVGENGLADEQEKGLEDLRKKQDELHDLIAQASQDIGDVQLRYRIATIAQFLGMSEMSNQWLKAARMIEIANAGLVNQPPVPAGFDPLRQDEPKKTDGSSP